MNNIADINNLVELTEDFMNFIDNLYKEGTINFEQHKTMSNLKNQFLKSRRR